MSRVNYQTRMLNSNFETRNENEEMSIEGYFAVFNQISELWPGATECISPGAFTETLGGDIRALIDHETRLVLGRNKAGTLELREDAHGLWGKIKINPNDTDAVNLYNRVKRGDVDQCSFGFEILDEDTDYQNNGIVQWTIKKVKLYEVSVVTFPAYEDTAVTARKKDAETLEKRAIEAWKANAIKKMKGDKNNGTKSTNA